ncbi:MAG: dihydroorotate dehydrogenase-like protein [Bacteroidales bacterium]
MPPGTNQSSKFATQVIKFGMAKISTKYLGLELKSPVIAGSSGMTNSVEKIVALAKAGAGAVVLKSLFEEQILMKGTKIASESDAFTGYTEALDYITQYSAEKDVSDYLSLIRDAKSAVDIPVIASINCVSSSEWVRFAGKIEEAGADALEVNLFILPSDPKLASTENEERYFEVARALLKSVKIPVALKLSHYFSGLANTLLKLSWTGIHGMVLFNRFFSPDIDIEKMEVIPSHVFSYPDEIALSLRWIAMLSDTVHCDLAASTGIHDGEAVVKQLLAGAKAVQVASALYKKGPEVITEMNQFVEKWLDKNGFGSLDEIIGKLSLKSAENPAAYERVQFMKHFAGIE